MKIQYQNGPLTVFESSLYRTTSSIIVLGHHILIVDPNWLPVEIDFIKDYISQKYIGYQQYLLFTHSDYDHIIGYGAFPNAITMASDDFVRNKNQTNVIKQILEFDHQYYIKRNYPVTYPKIDIIIHEERQVVSIGNFNCFFYKAPGHNRDALFLIIPELKCWIAGDYLSNIEIPFVDDNYDDYVHTLQKADDLIHEFPETVHLIPGHGDLTQNRKEIETRINRDLKYLEGLKTVALTPNPKLETKLKAQIKSYADNPELLKAHNINLRQIH